MQFLSEWKKLLKYFLSVRKIECKFIVIYDFENFYFIFKNVYKMNQTRTEFFTEIVKLDTQIMLICLPHARIYVE